MSYLIGKTFDHFIQHVRSLEAAVDSLINETLLCRRTVSFERDQDTARRDAVYALVSKFHGDSMPHLVLRAVAGRIVRIPADGEYFIPTNMLGDIYVELTPQTIYVRSWFRPKVATEDLISLLDNLYANGTESAPVDAGADADADANADADTDADAPADAPAVKHHKVTYLMATPDCSNWRLVATRPPNTRLSLTGRPVFAKAVQYLSRRIENPNTPITGVLLSGPPDCGKTSVAQYIAQVHGYHVFNVKLNHIGLTETHLEALIALVPEKSVILFDELDSSLDAALANDRVSISPGGVLSALCGGIPRSANTVLIVTTNSLDRVKALFPVENSFIGRTNRIDEVFEF